MDLGAGYARCAAAIARNLPRVITGRTDFKQMSVQHRASAVIMAARLTVFKMVRFILRLFCRLFSKLWRLGIVGLVEFFVGGHDRLAIHILHDDLELVHEEERLGAFLREGIEPLL